MSFDETQWNTSLLETDVVETIVDYGGDADEFSEELLEAISELASDGGNITQTDNVFL